MATLTRCSRATFLIALGCVGCGSVGSDSGSNGPDVLGQSGGALGAGGIASEHTGGMLGGGGVVHQQIGGATAAGAGPGGSVATGGISSSGGTAGATTGGVNSIGGTTGGAGHTGGALPAGGTSTGGGGTATGGAPLAGGTSAGGAGGALPPLEQLPPQGSTGPCGCEEGQVCLQYTTSLMPTTLDDFFPRCVVPRDGCTPMPASCACLQPCSVELSPAGVCSESVFPAMPDGGILVCAPSGP
jgi:hypothetical protein